LISSSLVAVAVAVEMAVEAVAVERRFRELR
jgi:hypothetical protein